MSQQTSDTVFVNGLIINAAIGCFAWEKTIKQKVRFDIEMDFDCSLAGKSDRLNDALDYSAVVRHCQEISAQKHYDLLEHLAETICSSLLAAFKLSKITLTVTKPNIIANVEAAGVRMVRYGGD